MKNINIFEDDLLQKMLEGGQDEQQTEQDQQDSNYQSRQGNYSNDLTQEEQAKQTQVQQEATTTAATENNPENMPEAFIYKQPEAVPQQQDSKPQTMYDLLLKQEAPKEDENLYKRAKKAALMDTIGKVFGNLAGATGQLAGGYVPQVHSDNNVGKLYGIIDKEKDKYDMLKRDWDRQLLHAKMGDMANELANKRLAQQMELERGKQDVANKKWAAEFGQRERKMAGDYAAKEAAREGTEAYRKASLGIQQQRLNKETAAEKKENEFYTWRNPIAGRDENPFDPNRTAMSRSEFDDVYDTAVYEYQKQPGGEENMKALMGQFQNNPLEAKREIVKWYLDTHAKQENEKQKAAERRVQSANLDKPSSTLGFVEKPDYMNQDTSQTNTRPKKGFTYGGKEVTKPMF